jgi:hypothetical protein
MGWFKKTFYYPKKLKKEALPFWEDKAGGEFNRGHIYQKKPGAFNKYMAFVHKSNALAYYGAAAASKLAPNNLATLALDIVSMGRGSVLTRVVGKSVALLRGTRTVARSSRAVQGLDSVGKATKAWSDTGSKLFKGRKAVKLGTVAARSIKRGSEVTVPVTKYGFKKSSTVTVPVSKINFKKGSEVTVPVTKYGFKKGSRVTVPVSKINFKKGSEVAVPVTKYGFKKGSTVTVPVSKINFKKGLEVTVPVTKYGFKKGSTVTVPVGKINFKGGLVPGPDIGDIFKSNSMNKIKKYNPPLRPHKPSVPPMFKHGLGKLPSHLGTSSRIGPTAKSSTFSQPSLSQRAQREIMNKGVYVPGVWGTEVARSQPGHSARPSPLPQPSLSQRSQREIMRKGVYVPGVWGMEINRSRPAPKTLSYIGRGLGNPNRARPLMKPMFR